MSMSSDDRGMPDHDPWGRAIVPPGGIVPPPVGIMPPGGTVPRGEARPLQETVSLEETDAPGSAAEDAAREPRRPWPLGYPAFGIAVLLVITEGIAVYLGSIDEPVAATILGQALVVTTAFPFALGLLAVSRHRQREWGLAAMVLSVIANPFILINVLGFFGAF